MALWGLIVAALLVIGSVAFFLGLTVVIPVLGHATWHLYRKAVEPGPNPHAAYHARDTVPLRIFRPRSSRRAVRDRQANRSKYRTPSLAVIADVHRFGTFRGLTTHFGHR
jgi:hypothetical protein